MSSSTETEVFTIEVRSIKNGGSKVLEVTRETSVTKVKKSVSPEGHPTDTVKLMAGTRILSDRRADGAEAKLGDFKVDAANNKLMLLARFNGGGGQPSQGAAEVARQLRRMSAKYLGKELIGVEPLDDELRWSVLLRGPRGSPYSSGVFELILDFPSDYPLAPPSVSFKTPIWHPNVYDDRAGGGNGKLCWDASGAPGHEFQADGIIAGVAALLAEPNPSSPANSQAARLFTEDRAAYVAKARKHTATHAFPAGPRHP